MINVKSFSEKFDSWWKYVSKFQGFEEIYKQLGEIAKTSEIYPKSSETFEMFKWCKYSNLKTIWVIPSPDWDLLDDLDIDIGYKLPRKTSLNHLYSEGILILPISLTFTDREKHYDIWKPFIKFLFKEVLDKAVGIPILIFSDYVSQVIKPLLNGGHLYKEFTSEINEVGPYDSFTWVNRIITERNGAEFTVEYDFDKQLPF